MDRQIERGRPLRIGLNAMKDIAGPYEHCAPLVDDLPLPHDLMGSYRKFLDLPVLMRIDLNMPYTMEHDQVVVLKRMHIPRPLDAADRSRRSRMAFMEDAVYRIDSRQKIYGHKIKRNILRFSEYPERDNPVQSRHFIYDISIRHGELLSLVFFILTSSVTDDMPVLQRDDAVGTLNDHGVMGGENKRRSLFKVQTV